MKNNIKVEQWLNNEIRFVEVNSEWWAVAGDVAKALDYDRTNRLSRLVDDEDITTHNMGSNTRGNPNVTIISEFGIYEAILNSRKPEAKEFKKWVKQVIKSLREATGLEQYEMFKMMDRDYQNKAMDMLKDALPQAEDKDYIKANTIANKAVSNKYGFEKMVSKNDMSPEMMIDRQPILADVVNLIATKEKHGLDFSVSKTIYKHIN